MQTIVDFGSAYGRADREGQYILWIIGNIDYDKQVDTTYNWQLILDAALTGGCALVVSQLLLTGLRQPWRVPLLLVFVGALWAGVAGLMLELAVPTAFALTGVAAVFMAITAMWVYTVMITTDGDIKPITHYVKHFIPVPLAILIMFPVTLLPDSELVTLFETGDVDTKGKFHAALGWIIAQFVWVCWAPPYLISIWNRLTRYRIALRDIHSSTERRELLWISALVGVLFLFWMSNALELLELFGFNSSFPAPIVIAIETLVIWIPALWGLRQIPGMQDDADRMKDRITEAQPVVQNDNLQYVDGANESGVKYERSALDDARATRIIAKLEKSMQDRLLFQNANLSLGTLANEIGVSKHYLSQSINEKLGVSFFEYINRQRTRQAAMLLKTTTQPVVDIALQSGFNSRSAFYKAFKKHYSTSPSSYRKG